MDNQLSDLKIISRPIPKWVIDRFEEDWAVLTNADTHESISLPQTNLPPDIKEGYTVIRQNGKWYLDEADTTARKQRISERFARIKAKGDLLK